MNLVPGTTYRLVCVKGKPIIWGENPKDDKNRKEGCSCIYGNPCEDPYVCEDWENRWDVAKKNGYKG
jgi:hypothetical protein